MEKTEKREPVLVLFTCPDCGKSEMVRPYTRRERCTECAKKRQRQLCLEKLRREEAERKKVMEELRRKRSKPRQDPNAPTVDAVLEYARNHGISSYGKAVAEMEKEKNKP